ncbi:MAG TPA: UDP-diphosphatase [Flavobacteriales bacterium]|jgi:undecaprenyl-diphosphatase|nr:UDP-diphosphatase [Flavobacteriales bacterium]
MSPWEAIILGIIQGLTEFLPVSSSGHLELGKALFQLQEVDLTFSILVHGATACSTLVVFRKDIAKLIAGAFDSDRQERHTAHRYIGWLALSTLPAVAVAFTLRDQIESVFIEHPERVGWSLCVTALILFLSERLSAASRTLSTGKVIGIGVAQALAIIPGISRSGSTIGTAIALGISREEAARFSFLMALPVIFGATALEIKDFMEAGGAGTGQVSGMAYALGTAAAFISGVAACQWMIRLVRKTNLNVFALYCLAVGLLAVWFIQ